MGKIINYSNCPVETIIGEEVKKTKKKSNYIKPDLKGFQNFLNGKKKLLKEKKEILFLLKMLKHY